MSRTGIVLVLTDDSSVRERFKNEYRDDPVELKFLPGWAHGECLDILSRHDPSEFIDFYWGEDIRTLRKVAREATRGWMAYLASLPQAEVIRLHPDHDINFQKAA